MIEDGLFTLYVDFAHLQRFDNPLSVVVSDDFYRCEPFLRRGLMDILRSVATSALDDSDYFIAFFNTCDIKQYVVYYHTIRTNLFT
jgi:hypothetical protein